MKIIATTERTAQRAFAPSLWLTLFAWGWLAGSELMGYRADWRVVVVLAPATLGLGFMLDAASTTKFGRKMVADLEAAPLMRIITRRYGLGCGVASQVFIEAAWVAVMVMVLGHMYGHLLLAYHLLAIMAIPMAVFHYAAWVSNNQYWRWSA